MMVTRPEGILRKVACLGLYSRLWIKDNRVCNHHTRRPTALDTVSSFPTTPYFQPSPNSLPNPFLQRLEFIYLLAKLRH